MRLRMIAIAVHYVASALTKFMAIEIKKKKKIKLQMI